MVARTSVTQGADDCNIIAPVGRGRDMRHRHILSFRAPVTDLAIVGHIEDLKRNIEAS